MRARYVRSRSVPIFRVQGSSSVPTLISFVGTTESIRRVIGIQGGAVRGAPDDVWRSGKEMGKRGNWNGSVELPIVCGEAVEVVALAGFDDLMARGAKAKSSPVLVLFDFNGAVDPLSVCPEAGAGDVIVAQLNLPYHAIGARWADLSVVPNDRDGLE
ncbi:hypothetical protein CRG98_012082 [Punica granatum]|uniref:Uncharacterized protein n=1 Tax=Punica granatum TaxID=22663 RepID=A0A2I0KG88_PUNGR|nr:hypothetical protein CRG98_012082 [Punica granatum]